MATKKTAGKPMPEENTEVKELPEATEANKELPKENTEQKELPEAKQLDKAMPPEVNPENIVTLGGEQIEIKPTKIKYQRNRTAAAYRILDLYPLADVLAMDKGIIDPERDGDAVVFDFLVAVFDDAKIVTKYYDSMTSEDVDRIVKIFKRLNHIDEKEEAAKNRAAKGTNR